MHSLNDLAFHAQHGSGGVVLSRSDMIYFTELATAYPLLELLTDMGIRRLAYTAVKRRFEKVAPVQHSGTLEKMLTGIGDSLLRNAVRFVNLALFMRPRFGYNSIGLMSILRGQLSMSS
jgi:hypothetical protein